MGRINARSNRGIITYFVECSDGQNHKVIYSADGTLIEYAHDVESEDVIVALSGTPSQCATARKIFNVASTAFTAWSGKADAAGLKSIRSGDWIIKDEYSCSRCRGRTMDLRHFNSVSHLAESRGIEANTSQVTTTFKWLVRSHASSAAEPIGLAVREEMLENGQIAMPNYFLDSTLNRNYVTHAYINLATSLFGEMTFDFLIRLRENFTSQWLTTFMEALSPKAKNRLQDNPALIFKIAKARNCNPADVAAFVNDGIYSHIYTYVNNHVSPTHAKLIFETYGANQNAKTFIEQGIPVARVVREIRA